MGQELLERKMNNVEATHADIIATGNPGCIMQIAMGVRQRNLPMRVVHSIQLLDEAYKAGNAYVQPPLHTNDTVTPRPPTGAVLLSVGAGAAALAATILLRHRRSK